MFDKLRWKLTAFNSVITSGIMICLVLLCLSLSERNTKDQTYKNFTDTVYAVSSYLEVQNQISDDWLRQMEADPNVHISVLDAGMPLFSMTLSPEKEKLDGVLAAMSFFYGFDPLQFFRLIKIGNQYRDQRTQTA